MENAQEFVLDSYKIKEGKSAILEMEGNCTAPLSSTLLLEYDDQIDEDDNLKIVIFHPPKEDNNLAVSAIENTRSFHVINGEIQLPHIPSVYVKGLTLKQACQKIQSLYDEEISNVSVCIEYTKRTHSNVELAGEVEKFDIPINGRTRLYEVLSLAHVNPTANLFKSYVVRDGQPIPVDIYKLLHEGDMSQNIVMRPKDKIFIAHECASYITVLTETGMTQNIPTPAGFISMKSALAAAGGIPLTANKNCILVIRGNVVFPKIYRLSWSHITHLPDNSLLLMPGDTIYLYEKPLTKVIRSIFGKNCLQNAL